MYLIFSVVVQIVRIMVSAQDLMDPVSVWKLVNMHLPRIDTVLKGNWNVIFKMATTLNLELTSLTIAL